MQLYCSFSVVINSAASSAVVELVSVHLAVQDAFFLTLTRPPEPPKQRLACLPGGPCPPEALPASLVGRDMQFLDGHNLRPDGLPLTLQNSTSGGSSGQASAEAAVEMPDE